MTDNPHDDLLAEIKAFCAARKMSKAAFGTSAVGDPRFVYDIDNGRECRRRTIRKVRHFLVTGESLHERRAAS
jgi:nucleoside phosphorylase